MTSAIVCYVLCMLKFKVSLQWQELFIDPSWSFAGRNEKLFKLFRDCIALQFLHDTCTKLIINVTYVFCEFWGM